MKQLLIVPLLILGSCNWLEKSSTSTIESTEINLVQQAVEQLNQRNIDRYLSYFATNINVFASNGLGTTRIVTGLSDFKGYSSGFTKAKVFKVKILNTFSVVPWVFAHQRMEAGGSIIEAAIGYRIDQGKIVDMMIIGEKRVN